MPHKIFSSKKFSSWIIILGFLLFFVPFFQLPAIVMLAIGTAVNYRSTRTKKQKLLWSVPFIICMTFGLFAVILAWR
jgi:hypothetical protein